MIDHVEALLARRIVDAADVDEARRSWHSDRRAGSVSTSTIVAAPAMTSVSSPIGDRSRVDRRAELVCQVGREVVQRFSSSRAAYRSIVPVRRIFFCSSSMP